MIGTDIKPLLYWCHKVLPLVYDDSLSYYEVLCQVVEKINEVIEVSNGIDEYIDEEIDEKLSDEHLQEIINALFKSIKDCITPNDETGHTNASKDWDMGDFIWFENTLYQATKNINQGVSFIFEGENTNVKTITLEEQMETVYYPNDKRMTIHGKISDYQQIVTAGDYHVYSPTREAIEIVRID